MTNKLTIEVVMSPDLYKYHSNDESVVVVVDVLRATSAICAAFANGAKELIPVSSVDEAREYKNQGYLLAAEREGIILPFADFGNSPYNFTPERVTGSTIAYSTTNGTKAINMASNAYKVFVGSFLNLTAVANAVQLQQRNLIILCSGWKGKFNIEDTLFAGALTELLVNRGFIMSDDSAKAAHDLWNLAKNNLIEYSQKVAQRSRLAKLGLDDVFDFCFTPDSTDVVPELCGKMLLQYKSN